MEYADGEIRDGGRDGGHEPGRDGRLADQAEIIYFETIEQFRAWLALNHQTAAELHAGFYKKDSGMPWISLDELTDEVLCWGWIDGIRHRIDDQSFRTRYTPRKPGSRWSDRNLASVDRLMGEGRMQPAGIAIWEQRRISQMKTYVSEQAEVVLSVEQLARFQRHPEAWAWFAAQPPGYQRNAIWWVVSAKRAETQVRRLQTLIEDSANGLRIKAIDFNRT